MEFHAAQDGKTAAEKAFRLLDTLHIAKADVVGWSDGAILGLDLALRHPDRVGRIFAFAANTVFSLWIILSTATSARRNFSAFSSSEMSVTRMRCPRYSK